LGPLTLPTSGIVYVDSNVIIYSVDRHQIYAPLLDPLWDASVVGHVQVVTSELAVMEAMIGPLSTNDPKAISDFERFFASSFTAQLPVDRAILMRAALARATTKALRTPDAIHLATALATNAQHVVTNDRDLCKASPIPTVLVDDLVATPPANP
jgi:predicted nucleic acid-binding protein